MVCHGVRRDRSRRAGGTSPANPDVINSFLAAAPAAYRKQALAYRRRNRLRRQAFAREQHDPRSPNHLWAVFRFRTSRPNSSRSAPLIDICSIFLIGADSQKSHHLCDDRPFVIGELQSRECQIVDTNAHPTKQISPE
jgi:hypothetical protein